MGTTGRNRKPWATASVAVLGLILGLGPATRAGEGESPLGRREGIKVHGDWTIEIRKPDGSLASRHEFKNSLTPIGATKLTSLLAGQEKACKWVIVTESTALVAACHQDSGCLTLSTDGAQVTLRGRVAAQPSLWDIAGVRTSLSFLDSGGSCPQASPHPSQTFTQRTLPAPITVQPEQSVDIKVVFSFS